MAVDRITGCLTITFALNAYALKGGNDMFIWFCTRRNKRWKCYGSCRYHFIPMKEDKKTHPQQDDENWLQLSIWVNFF